MAQFEIGERIVIDTGNGPEIATVIDVFPDSDRQGNLRTDLDGVVEYSNIVATLKYIPDLKKWEQSEIGEFVHHYLETALWTDELQHLYRWSDQAIERALADCYWFIDRCEQLGLYDKYQATDIAYDLWLTRNHHGAGFWDGDYGDQDGEVLTAIAHKLGVCELYQGDDGLLYFM